MIVITAVLLAFGFTLSANASPPEVKAKHYTCAELTALVQEEGTALIHGFGSVYVHSNASACDYSMSGGWQEAYESVWKTKDEGSCIVGYSCHSSDSNNSF